MLSFRFKHIKFIEFFRKLYLYLKKLKFSFYNFRTGRGGVYQVTTFTTYDEYLSLQKSKTLDPVRRKKWLNEEWTWKVDVFLEYFKKLFEIHTLNGNNSNSALCVGARTGQEVAALRELNIDAIGIDLVPFDPYVVFGDFHSIPFKSERFSFLFTNSFDHSLYPDKMIKEMCRVTAPKGIIVLHISLKAKTDTFGVTEVGNVKELLKFFENCKVLSSKKMNFMFGSNYEIVLKKL